MKNILRLLSLVLVTAMCMSIFTIGSFAADTEKGTTYTVVGYKTAVSNGSIDADEYSLKADLSIAGYSTELGFRSLISKASLSKVSEAVSISFAHDENKIYIGISDKSGKGISRGAYGIRLGFDEDCPENFVGIFMQCVDLAADGTSTRTNVHNALVTRSGDSNSYNYSQAGFRGILRSNGVDINWPYITGDWGGYTVMHYTNETKNVYPVTAMTIAKEAVTGNISSEGTTGHGRISSGQHYAYIEIELDKKLLLDYFNEMYPVGKGVENLDTMHFTYTQCESASLESSNAQPPYTMWGGSFGANAENEENAMSTYNFDKVVFLEKAVETLPPETEVPTTEPVTGQISEETEAVAGDKTEAPTVETPVEKGGCASTVSLATLTLVATIGTCATFITKKKEN